MILPAFELHRPTSLGEALQLGEKYAPDVDFIAGGTDLLQNYKNRLNVKANVVALDGVGELLGIESGRIGAMERLSTIGGHPTVRRDFPGLSEAALQVASPLVRNSATLGGNLLVETRCFYFNQTHFWRTTKGSCMKAESDECLVIPQKETCYAAYSGDVAPALLVLDASLELALGSRRRTVRVQEFYRGDGIAKNILERGEMILAVRLPDSSRGLMSGYRKLRMRDTLDYPEMGVAAALRLDEARRVLALRVATTAVDVVPQFYDASAEHAGRPLEEVVEAVATEMEYRAVPKKNTAMPVGYRKKMVRVYLRRLLREISGLDAVRQV